MSDGYYTLHPGTIFWMSTRMAAILHLQRRCSYGVAYRWEVTYNIRHYNEVSYSCGCTGTTPPHPTPPPSTAVRIYGWNLLYIRFCISFHDICCMYTVSMQTHYSGIIQFDTLCVCTIERNCIYLYIGTGTYVERQNSINVMVGFQCVDNIYWAIFRVCIDPNLNLLRTNICEWALLLNSIYRK